VQHPAYRDILVDGLKAIPTLSVALDPADLFDPARGIYANPMRSGEDWERAASIELLLPGGRKGLQSFHDLLGSVLAVELLALVTVL